MTGTMKRLGLGIAAATVAVSLAGGAHVAGQTSGTAQEPQDRGPRGSGGPGGPGGPHGLMGRGGRGGSGGPGMGVLRPMMLQRLDLTDAQKERVKGIVDSRHEEMRAVRDRAMKAHAALEAAITGDTFDEATVRTRAAEVAIVDADAAVHRARVYNEVYQILTPDQQNKLKTIQANMQKRMQNREENPRPRRGPGPR
jgi:periplasmic protein CpxP/Spy